MAYLTCPWCLTPQLVADDAAGYQCFTCYAEVMFFSCPECSLVQTVSKKWARFICANCDAVLQLPRRWGYSSDAKAYLVKATGHSWPKL
ncbi:MAG: hypothetical protein ACXWWL_07215 [Candidatus Limnocylindria bacterium]